MCRYMAPEMAAMLNQVMSDRGGYCETVDWWAFGVTMFHMLTGNMPHSKDSSRPFVKIEDAAVNELFTHYRDVHEFRALFQEVEYPASLSEDAVDLMRKLMRVEEKQRLGCGGPSKAMTKFHLTPFSKALILSH
jgi:serine/threonine protein kinase